MFLIFPYRIERNFKMPWATIAIIALCVLMFVVQLVLGLERSYSIVGFKPDLFAVVTWLSSMFAHGDILHLASNMYFLWVFGAVLEDAIGRTKYVMLYLAGGIVSTLAHSIMMLAFSPSEAFIPSLGASGAIAAIMGVAGVRFYKLKLRIWYFWVLFLVFRSGTFAVTAAVGLALYFARELLNGLLALAAPGGGIAYWAHISGIVFGAGVALAFGFGKELDTEEAQQEAQTWVAMGRHDLASAALANAPTGDPAAVLLARVRGGLQRPVPDVAAMASDATATIRELLKQGRKAEARDAYLEFAGYSSFGQLLDAAALTSVGGASEGLGDLQTAALAYYDVVRLYPGSPETERALYRLAHVYLAQGKALEATQTWAAFRQHFPGSEWRPYADQRLEAAPA